MPLRTTPGLLDSMMERAAGRLGFLDDDIVKSAMIQIARDAFVATNADGRIIEWNPAAERLLGWSREEVIGFPMHELLIPEEFREKHLAGMARHREGGGGRLFGTRLAMPALTAGGRITVELSLGAVKVRKKWVYIASMRRI